MKRDKKLTRQVFVRLTPEDYDSLKDQFEASDCWCMPEFIRRVLFERPVDIRYRSRFTADFMQMALKLKTTLQIAASVADQETIGKTVKEIEALMQKILQACSSM